MVVLNSTVPETPMAAGMWRPFAIAASVSAMKHKTLSIVTTLSTPERADSPQLRRHHNLPSEENPFRRQFVVQGVVGIALAASEFMAFHASAGEEGSKADASDKDDDGLSGAMKALFDPNEKTRSGKVLPKAYLKSAREVVKTLRESLKEDAKNDAKFRRNADGAKESIREYLNGWRGQKSVVNEESYVMIERAIRTLAKFYSKAGPSASLPEDVKAEILSNLSAAEECL